MSSDRPVGALLTIKRRIPPARPGAVRRAHLEHRLRAAGTPLTVVVAPAGWGKTSLLSSWAADPGAPTRVAWVSLDEGDDESTRFWTYVLLALRETDDEIGSAALDAVAAPGVDPIALALPLLLNELATSDVPHVLVLDDFHTVHDPRIHESVEFLVTYLPAALRLVIAGRADPPLPLARMRARGQLTEVRADDLRFSLDEATALVGTVSGGDLDHEEAAEVWQRTEGWAAGLQLAGLARRVGGAPTGAAHRHGADRHLLDYFAAEVLPAMTAHQRDLLVGTAPLDRLSGPLCDAALAVTGSAQVLRELDRADLFLVALDDDHEWYRCHHLFRDILLHGSGRSETADRATLRRAAGWFQDQGRNDDAVRHLLAAGDPASAADLLASSEPVFLSRGGAAGFRALGELLPRSAVAPRLAVSLAYASATSGRLDLVPHWLDRCDEGIAASTATIPGWSSPPAASMMLRAVIGTPDPESARAVELCRQAVELESAAGGDGLPIALAALGSALARDGRFAEAIDILVTTWRDRDSMAWSPGVTLQIGGNLGLSLLELDRGAALEALLREAVPLADDAERRWGHAAGPLVAMLRLVQGRHDYRTGDAEKARDRLTRAATMAEIAALRTSFVLALVFLADAELGCGDRAAARATVTRVRETVDDEPVTPYAMRLVDQAQTRIGQIAARSARRSGVLAEELTDRELSILRLLPGSATQREIGRAMFLSVNTVKAYNKSLYRKLGVASRQDAVVVARGLGLI
ncbi:LuxR C-terminal-related transcriptional regulator [Nakamurella sp.]|uniref:LuxR C-terminal-related transcriptional regulator n=1 Tax=Nakamurella sp. TaxID=1869182 RepID=UPI0037841631